MRWVLTLQQDLMAKHYEGKNEEGICLHLDLLDEVKATTEQWMARYTSWLNTVTPRSNLDTSALGTCFKESDHSCKGFSTRTVRTQLGRTIQNHWLQQKEDLILILTGWIDNQGCPRAPNPHPNGMDRQPRMPTTPNPYPKLSPTYGMDWSRMPTGTWSSSKD